MPCFWKTRAATACEVTIWATLAVRSYESMGVVSLTEVSCRGRARHRRARNRSQTRVLSFTAAPKCRCHRNRGGWGTKGRCCGHGPRRARAPGEEGEGSASIAEEAVADPVARELVSDAAAAVALLVGPGDGRFLRLPRPL